MIRDGAHPLGIPDRGATELLHDKSHGRARYRSPGGSRPFQGPRRSAADEPVASRLVANPANSRARRSRETDRQQAQLEARQLALHRAQRKRRFIGIGVLLVVVAATVGGVLAATSEKDNKTAAPPTTGAPTTAPSSTIAANPNPPAQLPTVVPGETISGPTPCPEADGSSPRVTEFTEAPPLCIDPAKGYDAVIRTSKGSLELFLLPEASPQTVNNFVTLARYHYYDGLPITRVVPRGWGEVADIAFPNGSKGPGYSIPSEADARGTVATPNTVAMIPDASGNTTGAFLFGIADQYVGMPANVVQIGTISDARIDKSPTGDLTKTVIQLIDKIATESGRPAEVVTIEGIDIIERAPAGSST